MRIHGLRRGHVIGDGDSLRRTSTGGGVTGAAAAANQTLDPNGDVSQGADWYREAYEAASYISIDDGAVPNDLDYVVYTGTGTTFCEFSFPEPTAGTINTMRVHARAVVGGSVAKTFPSVSISRDGTNFTSITSIGSVLGDAVIADYTKDFTSLSWATPTDLRIRLYGYEADEWVTFYRIRLEVNP